MIDQLNFGKMNGLIPVVVQDADANGVLMAGFMNKEALQQTIEQKQVVFWSRTKNRLWKKGETSGNYLDLVSIHPDCDNDALLIKAHPRGPVCHTGKRSCFGDEPTSRLGRVLEKLSSIIKDRNNIRPKESYTTSLFAAGVARIGQKVGEEAVELAIAAQYDDTTRCIEESADLLYHLLVLLEAKGLDTIKIAQELEKRMNK
jgi:phosphoribosyl-AMP cyclohydrolase / phosphoribosyl-ATP pyrophosphohydrolase